MPKIEDAKQLADFADKVRDFIERNRLSLTTVAKKIHISPTQLSQFLNNKYAGDTQSLCEKLTNLVNSYERRHQRIQEPDFVETSVAKKIISIINQTEKFARPTEGRICLIVGDAGHGKSVTLLAYHKSNPNSIYIKLTTKMSSQAIFSEIAAALKEDPSGGVSTLAKRIRENIQDRELTVLIDEASWLDVTRLDQLRQVIVESGCTLVLAGNHHLVSTIGQNSVRSGYEALDQFKSRMLCILDLNAAAQLPEDDGGIYTSEDIHKLFEYGIRLTKDGAKELKKIAKTPQTGRLRTCSIIIGSINNSRQARFGEITEIDAKRIRNTIRQLMLPIRDKIGLFVDLPETEQEETKAKTA